MTTAALEAPTAQTPERRFILPGVDWDVYRKISDALTGRHVRLSYAQGRLEFTTISPKHGNRSRLLGRLVATLAEETGRPLSSFGDMTCDRPDLEKGVEPDECFYIDNEPLIRGKDKLDFTVDPPPDLGIEVDITSSSRIRMGIYAALGVAEIWRYSSDRVAILVLQPEGGYSEPDHSRIFPFVTSQDLTHIVELRLSHDETSLMRVFRDWINERQPS
jgi:Uma2 family endonuclease